MNGITNTDDIIDVRDIIGRVEDLEDQRTHKYAAGLYMHGYMPYSEPAEFDDADDARAYIIEEMRNYAVGLDGVDDEESEKIAALIEAADALENLIAEEAEAEYENTIAGWHYWISYEGLGGLDDDESEELKTLTDLLDDLKGNGGDEQWRGDWYPLTLIRDSYFKDYAQELAEEIDAIPNNAQWPCTCIDWEQAAQELRMDYSSTEYDGVTYWYQ